MSGDAGANKDEIRISSKDLKYLLRAGNFNFEKLDDMPIDPRVAKQIQKFSEAQSAGFRHRSRNIELNVVRLCFQMFLPDDQGKINRIVPPVVSQTIHDKLALNVPVICRVSRRQGKTRGGDEVFLLCEEIRGDAICVRFYEERDGWLVWEHFGEISPIDVHKQCAIVFKTPPYHEYYLNHPVEVQMQIKRLSDLKCSNPTPFIYLPEDPDPDRIVEKRKRKAALLKGVFTNCGLIEVEANPRKLKFLCRQVIRRNLGYRRLKLKLPQLLQDYLEDK